MSKYRITLEGKTYEMEIELVPEETAAPSVVKREYREFKAGSPDPNVYVMDPSAQKPVVNNTGAVTAPMPGTVIRIEKETGAEVKEGDLVLILEAMKMENEIFAPKDGTITQMYCKAGSTVAGGEVLFEIK